MAFFSWSRWLRSLLRPQAKPIRKRPPHARRPHLEVLEPRLAPSTVTFTWTGQAGDGKWSDPQNWLSNNVHAAPKGTGNEDLVFPSGALLFTANNDIKSGTGPNSTPIFNSISITGTGYTIGGLPITLGSSTALSGQTGEILENGGAGANNTIAIDSIILGGGADSGQQDFSIAALNTLSINSVLASPPGAPGKGLKDIGNGTLVLTSANTFIEPFTIVSGIVQITNAQALGNPTATGSTNATTVDANAQLQLNAGTGPAFDINEPLFLNGPGTHNDGALLNLAGNNIWDTSSTSFITLGNTTGTVFFGVAQNTSLNIRAQINDQGSGVGVEKVGKGQLIFSHVGGNIYRGNTDIEDGILTIQDPNALGNGFLINGVPHVSTTTVNDNPVAQTFGTLQLDNEDPTRKGFVVSNELLILDSANNTVALENLKGNNTWTGNVTLGATVNPFGPLLISVDSAAGKPTDLLISGVIGDPSNIPLAFDLDKLGTGKLILTNSNTYRGATNVEAGVLNVEDSRALGQDGKGGVTTVANGAALELQLQTDNVDGMIPVPALDSRTGRANQMVFEQALNLSGNGINGTGALHSISGVNAWEAQINVGGSIGVDPDPHPSNSQLYFPAYDTSGHVVSGDYSLTVGLSADMVAPVFPATGGSIGGALTKVGGGQLILPQDNSVGVDIQAGWITISTNNGVNGTTVESGAALQLKPAPGVNLALGQTFTLSGTGIAHPFGMISHMGALESMSGQNVLTGTLLLNGVAGIGVEHVSFNGAAVSFGQTSQMMISGYIYDVAGTHGGITKLGSDRLTITGMGTYTGPVDIADGVLLNQSATGLGAGGYATSTTTTELGMATVVTIDIVNAVPNSTTYTLALNGTPVKDSLGNVVTLTYTGNAATDTAALQTALQAAVGTAGTVTVRSVSSSPPGATTDSTGEYEITFGGGLLTTNETLTATKTAGTGTVTAVIESYGSGTALELANSLPTEYLVGQVNPVNYTGGIGSGLAIWGEHLILNGAGDPNYGDTASLNIITKNDPVLGPFNDPLIATDQLWNGPVTLLTSTNIYVAADSRITIFGTIDDGGANNNLTFNGPGQVNLAGPNTYGGMTNVNSGVLTVMNNQALGAPGTAAVQTIDVSALPAGATYTVNFNNAATPATVAYTGNATTDIAALIAALDALPTIGGPAGSDLGGSVNVVENAPGVFTVTLGGSLSGFHQNLMTSTTSGVQIAQINDGTGGTVVKHNAQLQIAGSITVAGEPLLVYGNGNPSLAAATPNVPSVPTQWFPVGPAPMSNGQTAGHENVGGRITGIVTLGGTIFVATAGGGLWKTVDNGNSWRPVLDAIPDLETLTFAQGTGTQSYTLSFTGPDATGTVVTQQTGTLTFDPNNIQGSINAMEQALDGLSNIGGVGGEVTVTQQPGAIPPTFLLTFGGVAMSGANLTGALTASGATEGQKQAGPEVGFTPSSPFFAMYIGAITNDNGTLYIGTGEANNSGDSYYGTGLYKSTNGGVTWSLVVDKISNGTGPAFNPFYGMAINKIAFDPQSTNDLYVAASSIVSGTPLPNMATAPASAQPFNKGGTVLGGIWRYAKVGTNSGPTWFNMTNVVTSARNSGLQGQNHPPNPQTPGPDDDFRLNFPTSGQIDWTDVAVIDTDVANNGAGGGAAVPVVYGALGDPQNGDSSNGFSDNNVYRCQNALASTEPVWYVGDPGTPQNQVEELVYTWTGTGSTASYTFEFQGKSTAGIKGLVEYLDNQDQTSFTNGVIDGLNVIIPGGSTNYSASTPSNGFAVGTATVDVTFTNKLGNSPQPLIKIDSTSTGLKIVPSIKTPGGGVDTESSGAFNALANNANNGVIRLGVAAGSTLNSTTVYASVTNYTNQSMLAIDVSTSGGKAWANTGAQPNNDQGNEGAYDNSILVQNASTVYVGGMTNNVGTGSNLLFGTSNGGGSWTDYSIENGVGPHTSIHALAIGGPGLLVGTDGGLFGLNTGNTPSWTDMNGGVLAASLDNALMNTVAVNPTDPSIIYGGAASNGLGVFNALPGSASWQGTPTWNELNDYSGSSNIVGASTVLVDPNNPQIIYQIQDQLRTFPSSVFVAEPPELLLGSTDGGKTWTTLRSLASTRNGVLVMDPLNTSRLLLAGVLESTDGGKSWLSLGGGGGGAVAVAGYQGVFAADPRFPAVTDVGANTYVPDTIYAANGSSVSVTKDHGLHWASTSVGGPGNIVDLQVDPRNRDTVYAVFNGFATSPTSGYNGGQVYVSTDAGQTWNAITNGLPDVRAWKLVIDPRTGNLYVGTDLGVYELPYGANLWQRFGTGMPNVEVKNLVLNQTTNMLVAATYGRGTYELFLDAQQSAAPATQTGIASPLQGAIVALSGQAIWTGPVVLGNDGSGSVSLGADGNPALTNGIAAAQLEIHGTISDRTLNAPVTIDKIGTGNVVLSGANTFGGLIDIQQGVVIVNNPQALGQAGAAANGTVVENGAALWLESSVGSAGTSSEALTLNGDGPAPNIDITNPALKSAGVPTIMPAVGFDGHNTGALESIANTNTYFGPITLNTNATIGVASQSVLTIMGSIGETAGQNDNFTKELAGTLVLDDSNTYTGTTFVNQGALQILNPNALADTPITDVLDGAQIQVAAGVTVPGTLSLSGTGIAGTGAMLGVDGTAGPGTGTWSGNVTLDATPGFSALSDPLGVVAFGANLGDILKITGTITDETNSGTASLAGLRSGLETVGGGTVALANANTYSGTTYVTKGSTLQVQNALALGGYANPQTNNSANEQVQDAIQRLTVFDPNFNGTSTTGFFTVAFGGKVSGQLQVTSPTSTIAGAIAGVLGVPAGAVSVTKQAVSTPLAPSTAPTPTLTEFVFTVVFDALTLANAGLPIDVGHLLAAGVGNVAAAASVVANGGVGALVEDGGTLAVKLPDQATVSGVALQLNGTGVGGNGALQNVGASNTTAIWAGPNTALTPQVPAITLGTKTVASASGVYVDSIGGNAGTTLVVQPASGTLPITGVVTAELAKVGPGTLFLPSANSYLGTTDIQDGVVQIANANALGAPPTDEFQTLSFDGSLSSSFDLSLDGTTIATGVSTNYNDPNTLASLQTQLAGIATVKQAGAVYTLDFNGTFNGKSLAGQPVDLVTTDNSSVVPAEVTHGGLGATIVENGGTLDLRGGIAYNSGEVLTLNGPGFNPGTGALGALESSPGTAANTWSNQIILATDSAIGVDPVSPSPPPASPPSPTPAVGLVINVPITGPAGFDKINQGTLELTGSASNTYGGTATVTDGLMELAMTGGAIAIPGPLVVGDATSKLFPVAQLEGDNQIASNQTVSVNADGVLDLNGHSQTLGQLNVTDGTVHADAGGATAGSLTLTSATAGAVVLNMVGGVINLDNGGALTLGANDNVTATSDPALANPAATILGSNAVLSAGKVTFTVNFPKTTPATTAATDGVDLDVRLPITAPAGSPVTKNGPGRLELDADSTATLLAPLVVNVGDVQVDGAVTAVSLESMSTGGSVGGTGTIGTIDGGAGNAPVGTINPGDNGLFHLGTSAAKYGILNTGTGSNVAWGSATTFAVDLSNLSGNLTPGKDYDQLTVNGNLTLGGARLVGSVDPSVLYQDQFTILTTTGTSTISGRFAEPYGRETDGDGIAYIAGQKFDVHYNTNSVVLLRDQDSVTQFTISSPLVRGNSLFGQDAVFQANVTLDSGNGIMPAGDSVQFTVSQGATVIVSKAVTFANGAPVFDPQKALGAVVPVGMYTVTMSLNPDPNIVEPPPATYSFGWTISPDNTSISLAPAATTTPWTVPATVTATLSAAPVPGGQLAGTPAPAGTLTFIIDNGPTVTGTAVSTSGVTRVYTAVLPTTLAIATHTITASYADTVDSNYNGSTTTSGVFVTVTKDATTATVGTIGGPPTYVGQAVTLTALVTANPPATQKPQSGETVTFFDAATNTTLGNGTLDANGNASLTVASLPVGTHKIEAEYPGDSFLAANDPTQGTLSFTVKAIPTTTMVTSSANPALYQQTVTLSATVAANPTSLYAGPGTLSGTVDFYDGSLSNLIGAANLNSSGLATVAVNSLTPTGGTKPHNIFAVYTGNTDYVGSQSTGTGNVSEQVEFGDSVAVTAAPNPATYGMGPSLTITATVTTAANTPPGNPLSGTVTFYDGTTQLGNPVTVANGQALLTLSNTQLAPGNHDVTATFQDGNPSEPFYITTTSPKYREVVLSQTTTTLTSSTNGNPAGFGTTVTFTAAVAAQSPGTGAPASGTVQFIIDGTLAGTGSISSGVATYQTSTLALTINQAPHQVVAKYLGDGPGYAGSTSAALGQAVYYNDTVTASAAPSTIGTGLTTTLIAVVAPVGTATLPTGTVTFFATTQGSSNPQQLGNPVVLSGNGQSSLATLPWAFSPAGTYLVTATYNLSANPVFINNTSAPTTVIVRDTTATALNVTSKTAQPYVFGQTVTLNATVSATSGNPLPTPTGSVTFYVNGTQIGTPVAYNGTPISTTTTALPVGNSDAVTAVYTSNNNPQLFGSTSAAATVAVNPDGTTTTLTSAQDLNNATVYYSEPLTMTATVQADAPGGGTPTGTVVFKVDGAAVGGSPTYQTDANGNLEAILLLPSSVLTATGSPHTIEADYTPSTTPTNYVASSGTLSQSIAIDGTNTSLNSSTGTNPAVYGQQVTYTVSVTAQSPGQGVPTGTVEFSVDGTAVNSAGNPVTLTNGSATFVMPALPPLSVSSTPHTVLATYQPDPASNGNFAPSSKSVSQTVNATDTQTTLSATPNPSLRGQSVTFQATITAIHGGAGTPTGSVQFSIDGIVAATVPLAAGSNVAQYVTASLSATAAGKPHTILAQYLNSDGNFNDSQQSVQQTVNGIPTTTTVSLPVNTAVYSAPLTLFATVALAGAGSGTPTGSVQFYAGSTAIGAPATLGGNGNAANVASLDISTITPLLNAGKYNITAQYAGDSNFAFSNSATTQTPAPTLTITQDATTTSEVTSSAPPPANAVYSEPVTFTAIISPKAPGTAILLGSTVNFYNSSTLMGPGTVAYNAGTKVYYATFTTSTLTAGTHYITARYVANADDGASASPLSPVLSQVINHAQTSVAMTSSNSTNSSTGSPSVYGQTVTFTAAVTSTGLATGTPTGSVTFIVKNSSNVTVTSGTSTLSGGIALFRTAVLQTSTTPYSVTAVYNGAAPNYAGSTSTALSQTVDADATNVNVVGLPNPVIFGPNLTLTASVTAAAPGGGVPTGSVTFHVDGTQITSVTFLGNAKWIAVVDGANLLPKTTLLTEGAHTATVSFTSNGKDFLSSGPTSTTFNVNYATKISLSSSTKSSVVFAGAPFTLTATVSPGSTSLPATAGAPTGSVNFLANGSLIGNAPLSGTGSTLTAEFAVTNGLSAGSYTITAQYVPDSSSKFAPVTSTGISQPVYAVPTSITASVNPPSGILVLFSVTAKLLSGSTPILLNNGTATITQVGGPAGGLLPSQVTVSFNNSTHMFTFSGLRVSQGTTAANPYVLKIVYNDPTGTLNLAPAYVSFTLGGRIS